MSILDQFPFPFGKPEGQELMRVMAALFRTPTESLNFAEACGIDVTTVNINQSTINLWHDLLQMLARDNGVRAAVEAARQRFPRNPRVPFLDSLLADAPARVSAEPMADKGPGFDDSVKTPEALLFFDDLTMPMGKVSNLVSTLNAIIAAAPAVCLLRVENPFGSFFGTGFRIGERRVLTNHHVLFPHGAVATKVYADFGFDVDAAGVSSLVTSLTGDPASIAGESGDDWAVVEVHGMAPDWPTLALDNAPAPRVGDAAYILQHPGGQQKRLGFVRNTISDVEVGVIRYLTDTEPGSSGAPVLDTSGRVIALHHAGGRPVEVLGRPPVAKNEGIRISRVVERLAAKGLLE
jgi:S1-C subfamily serine protease